jgi:SAM-dependent methyltransferase
MTYARARRILPGFLLRWIYHFEAELDRAVETFALTLPAKALVLDAGAGEARHAPCFARQRYLAVDLAVGDSAWNYRNLHVIADLAALPFPDAAFDAALNIVTLEHLPEPAAALAEIGRVLQPAAPLLIVAPHQWEVHQAPHDYYRYTRFGLQYLLEKAHFDVIEIRPVGGLYRFVARRLWAAALLFPAPWQWLALLAVAPAALLLPVFDRLDRDGGFTPGYIALAWRRA